MFLYYILHPFEAPEECEEIALQIDPPTPALISRREIHKKTKSPLINSKRKKSRQRV